MKIDDYCILLTRKCNWNCSYCAVDTNNPKYKETTRESIEYMLNNIPENITEVSLAGGEPGLASKEIVEYAVMSLVKQKKKIFVLTNGEWFKRYSYLNKYISLFSWHIMEDIVPIKVDIPSKLDIDKTEFIVVATDKNIDKLDECMTLNPFINFIIGADPYEVLNQPGDILSKKNAINIVKKYKNVLLHDSIMMLLHNCEVRYNSQTYNL